MFPVMWGWIGCVHQWLSDGVQEETGPMKWCLTHTLRHHPSPGIHQFQMWHVLNIHVRWVSRLELGRHPAGSVNKFSAKAVGHGDQAC